MKVPENKTVRPTLRCLLEDLGNEAGPEELRPALRTARADLEADDLYLLPVHLAAVTHPALAKANEVAGYPPSGRERIEVITDRWVTKVKTGDRRAAMWQDAHGTWWLLAVGRRKNDEAGDFYREMERYSSNSDPIAPTDADERYQALEAGMVAVSAAEQREQEALLGALLQAALHVHAPQEAMVFGAAMTVTVRRLPDVDVLELSWELVQFDEQDRFPQDVLAMVPGLESMDDWDYLPPRSAEDKPFTWYTYVSPVWVDWLATAAELDDLLGEEWEPPVPRTDGSEPTATTRPGQS